jgi:uncharacterized protein
MKQMKRVFAAAAVATCVLGFVLSSALRPAEAQDAPRQAAAAQDAPRKAAAAATFEVYKDKAGEFRWRLRTQNRNVIATSGAGYGAKRDCLAAIESVKKNAQAAPVEEMQEEPKEQPK